MRLHWFSGNLWQHQEAAVNARMIKHRRQAFILVMLEAVRHFQFAFYTLFIHNAFCCTRIALLLPSYCSFAARRCCSALGMCDRLSRGCAR